jgi:hypothetical protein
MTSVCSYEVCAYASFMCVVRALFAPQWIVIKCGSHGGPVMPGCLACICQRFWDSCCLRLLEMKMEGSASSEMSVLCTEQHDITSLHIIDYSNDYVALARYPYTTSWFGFFFINYSLQMPIPVAARSKTFVCGRLPAEIVGSNPTGGVVICLWVLCFVR